MLQSDKSSWKERPNKFEVELNVESRLKVQRRSEKVCADYSQFRHGPIARMTRTNVTSVTLCRCPLSMKTMHQISLRPGPFG